MKFINRFFIRSQLKHAHLGYAAIMVDQILNGSIIPKGLADLVTAFVKRPFLDEATELALFDARFLKWAQAFDLRLNSEVDMQNHIIQQMPECSRIFRLRSTEDKDSYLFFDARVALKIIDEKEKSYLSTEWSRPEYLLAKRWLSTEKEMKDYTLSPRAFIHTFESIIPTAKALGEVGCYCSKCGDISELNEITVERGDEWNKQFGYALGCTKGHMVFQNVATVTFD
jgi:hypothetical protein